MLDSIQNKIKLSRHSKRIIIKLRKGMLKNLIFLLLITALSTFTYSLFLENMQMCLLPVSIVTVFAAIIIGRIRNNRRQKSYNYQFLWLMEYVSTALSTGSALESILVKAAEDINEQSSEKYKDISIALKKLRSGVLIHLDLDRSLQTFISDFPCDSAQQILGNIFFLKRSGGRIDQYILDSTRMLREQVELIRGMEAEQSGKATETYIMATAPFVMALVLSKAGSFQEYIYYTSWGALAMTTAYIVSCFSFLLAILIGCSSYDRYKYIGKSKADILFPFKTLLSNDVSISKENVFMRHIHSGGSKIKQLYKDYLPTHIWQRIVSQIKIDALFSSCDYEKALQIYFSSKLLLLGLLCLIIPPIIIMNIEFALLLILFPLIFTIPDMNLLSKYQQRSSQENMRFPQWLNLLAIMLNSGLSLQRSLQICSRENKLPENRSNSNRIDYFELEQKRMRLQITNGVSPSLLLSDLSERCTIFQIKYVLDLIVRYERDGGKEILGIISLSAGSVWQVYRDELKKKLQSKNLLFLVPCGLSLVAVIATALIPAAAMLMVGN